MLQCLHYYHFCIVSSCGVISKLRNLANGATDDKYSTLIDCLCRWGKVGHILELIHDWMIAEPSTREVCYKKRSFKCVGLCKFLVDCLI